MRHLNETVLPKLGIHKRSVSESTAKRWMIAMKYQHKIYRKGVYMDGHERADVVKYRTQFLGEVLEMQKYVYQAHHFHDLTLLVLDSCRSTPARTATHSH